MLTRGNLLQQIEQLLKSQGYKTSDTYEQGSFDLVARKNLLILLLKTFLNIDSINEQNAHEMKQLANIFLASPIIIGEKSRNGILEEGVVYERYDIPTVGFENLMPTYQFIKCILKTTLDLELDNEHMMVISPDEGAMHRAIYFANHFGVDVGMFYKRRDYSKVVNGKNPIVAHEFLGDSVEGKDVFIIDDMIASGESMLDVCRKLKARKARRVFCVSTFGLFTAGLEVFDKAYEEGVFDRVISTNVTYQKPELFEREWYSSTDLSKYIAIIIDHLNHDSSISELLDPVMRIQTRINEYKEKGTISDNYDRPSIS